MAYDDDYANLGLLIVEKRRSSKAATDFEASFQNVVVEREKAVADLEEQMEEPQDLSSIEKAGQSDDLHKFM